MLKMDKIAISTTLTSYSTKIQLTKCTRTNIASELPTRLHPDRPGAPEVCKSAYNMESLYPSEENLCTCLPELYVGNRALERCYTVPRLQTTGV